MSTKLLGELGKKIGLSEDAGKIIRKADEFRRLIAVKSSTSSGLSSINDTVICLVCLELACNFYGTAFDHEQSWKISGKPKSAYSNSLQILEKVVGLETKLSIKEICLKIKFPEAESLASDILNSWTVNQPPGRPLPIKDCPSFSCAAVWAALIVLKKNIDKKKLVQLSRIKKTALENQVSQMVPFAKTSLKRENQKEFKIHEIEDNVQENKKLKRSEEEKIEKLETFTEWRARLLKYVFEEAPASVDVDI